MSKNFAFAGFSWPRNIARAAFGMEAVRNKWLRSRKVCGEYVHAPTPNTNAPICFYLDNVGQPFARWVWADKTEARIGHTGWFTSDFCDEKIRGIVVRLPHGRYLAGWAIGVNMLASVETEIFTNEAEAAYFADSMAEQYAQAEWAYQARFQEAQELQYAIEAKKTRVGECWALRNKKGFAHLRGEASQVCNVIRNMRAKLASQYDDCI